MSVGVFTGKAHPPTIEQVFEAIGPKRSAWEELTRFIWDEFSAQGEFRFNGKNYGWALRFRKSGKALVSLYPGQNSFTVQVILGEADTQKARALRLGKHVRQIIDEAHAYPEGRWLFVPVKSAKDIKDVQQLLALKRTARPTRTNKNMPDA